MASANAYVTLEQFGKIISENSQTLAKMGGSVNDGAKSFAMLSHELISSEAGSSLLALGYSTEEVNSSMLNYINATGGRSKQELANTAAVTNATTAYMTELDKLTQFSGTSRKQQEEEQQEESEEEEEERYWNTDDEIEYWNNAYGGEESEEEQQEEDTEEEDTE